MNKKIMLAAATITILGTGIFSAGSAFAQSSATGSDPMSSIVEKIAQKFNLNQAEVQAVFDEAHKEREAQFQAAFETKLNEYVANGEITEEQKQLILSKHAELKTEREKMMSEMENKTPEERRSTMEAQRQELETWAKENGIDMKYLLPKFHMRFKGGRGGEKDRVIMRTGPAASSAEPAL